MFDREAVCLIRDPSQVYFWLSNEVKQQCHCLCPDSFFVASTDELQVELGPLAQSKGLTFEEAAQNFECLLTGEELGRLRRYEACRVQIENSMD